MKRDFSESAKNKLLGYVADVTETTTWGKIGDSISDATLHVSHWLGFLNINKYVNDLDAYHKKIIDKNNTTSKQIEDIFSNVAKIDTRYKSGIDSENSYLGKMLALLDDLSNTIDPSGGNLDMTKMSSVLQADIDQIVASQTSTQKVIENENLGTDPIASPTSVDPVNLATGNFIYEYRDLAFAGENEFYFHRYYNSKDSNVTSLGSGFRHNFDIRLVKTDDFIDVSYEDGKHIRFSMLDGKYISEKFVGDYLTKLDDGYRLDREDGSHIIFDESGCMKRLENNNGVGFYLEYDENTLTRVVNDYNDFFEFTYSGKLLSQVIDSAGRTVSFKYDNDKLSRCSYNYGKIISYKYSKEGKISELSTGNDDSNIENEYDDKARVVHQKFGDGSEMFFEYNDENKSVIQTERNGVKTVYYHDEEYRNTKIVYHDDSTEEYIFNNHGQCIRHIDRMGKTERMSYDNRGNLTQKIDALKRRINFTYDSKDNLLSVSVNGKQYLKNYYDNKGNLLSTENGLGNKNAIKYDAFGRIVMLTSPDGGTEEYMYNENGDIVSAKNHFGGITRYEYDSLHRVTRITNPLGGETRYSYTDSGNIESEINEEGQVKRFYYDEKGLLVKCVDYNGASTERRYNEINKVSEYIDEHGNKTVYLYDKMWNVSKVITPSGSSLSYVYDNDNNLVKVIDSLGVETNFLYDLNGNCIGEERNGVCSKYYYDAVGRKNKIQYLNGTTCSYEYDMLDNLIHIDNEDGIQVYMEYDDANNLVKQTNSEGEVRIFSYTEDGKIKTIEDEFGRLTKYEYIPGEDKYSNIIYPDGTEEHFSYDDGGNLIRFIDRNGNVMRGEYNKSNRLVRSYLNEVCTRQISYDSMGNIIEITDAEGAITKYSYSLKNELIKLENAEGCVIEYTYNENGKLLYKVDKAGDLTRTTKFEYDILDRLISCIDPCGNVEKFEYDSFDNLISKIDKDGFLTKYVYTNSGKLCGIEYEDGRKANFLYDKHDYLCKVTDWLGTTEIINDACGRAVSVLHPNGDEVLYSYNTAGKRTSIQYPSGKKVVYEYDDLLRLSGLNTDGQIISYTYDDRGRLISKNTKQGVKTEYGYSLTGLLNSQTTICEGKILDSINYDYDIFGRKISTTRKNYEEKSNDTYSFKYDIMGRLNVVDLNGDIYTKYEYDQFGNRTRLTKENEVTEFRYNDLNQLLESSSESVSYKYRYDGRGNLVSLTSTEGLDNVFSYGSINRLEKAKTANGDWTEYKYNALGYRLSKAFNTGRQENYTIDITKQYDNLLQMRVEGAISSYVWDRGLTCIDDGNSSEDMYCIVDDLGSPIRLFDGKNNTVETYGYDLFGAETKERKTSVNPFTFTGYQQDKITGLYFAQAREYIPMAGRFAARDLVAGKIDSINSQNDYLYCEDDPNDYVDKNGLFLLTAIVIGVAVGAATSAAINGVSQGIKIAQGKQDSWKWGEFIGSTVEGAVVGGLGAIPGLGPAASLAVKVGGGAVGAAANSLISQGIDDGKIDGGKVGEDALAGAAFGAISFGIDKGIGAVKTKIFGKDTTKTTAKSVYKEFDKASEGLKKAQTHYDDVINSGHKPSSLTRKTLENAKNEVSDLTHKYFKTWGKEKAMSFVTGKSGILRSSVRNLFGYEIVKQVGKKAFKKWLPWYSDGQDDIMEYLDDYYGTLAGKATGKCPVYA